MAHRWLDDTDFRIGTDPNALISLRRLGIPIPDQTSGDRASTYYERSDATRVGDGYAHTDWIWDVISLESISRLLEYLNEEDFVRLYVRTTINQEFSPNPRSAFDVYYGIMYRPILSGTEGMPVARSPYNFQTVKIQFRNLILQPGYL